MKKLFVVLMALFAFSSLACSKSREQWMQEPLPASKPEAYIRMLTKEVCEPMIRDQEFWACVKCYEKSGADALASCGAKCETVDQACADRCKSRAWAVTISCVADASK